jgi:hypothetical protein
MKDNKLKLKKGNELPLNYLLTSVEEALSKKDISEGMIPVEYCKKYNADMFVRNPFKKIIEY